MTRSAALSALVLITLFSVGSLFAAPPNAHRVNLTHPELSASTCPDVEIPNFDVNTDEGAFSFTFTWDPPAGVGEPVYEILRSSAGTWCDQLPYPAEVVATTSSTTYSTTLPSNQAWGFAIRVQSCPDITAGFYWVFDTFTTPPGTPSLSVASAGGGVVNLNWSVPDDITSLVVVYRDAGTGPAYVTFFSDEDYCPPGSTHTFMDDGSLLGKSAEGLPNGSYTYRLQSINYSGGTFSSPVTATVGAGSAASIRSFTASPALIRLGESTTLVWSTRNASGVSIDHGVGTLPANGTISVTPTADTTYTMTAIGSSGNATATTSVKVITSPSVSVTSFPRPLVQGTNAGGATTSYILTNSGGQGTSISLQRSGSFFTQSPTSFNLSPGQSQKITITGIAQPSGAYVGGSVPSGNGVPPGLVVPVGLLSAPTPSGPTSAKAANTRVDVAAPSSSNPSGTAQFTNTGEVTLTGVVTSSVPWIIPQSGIVTIPPGETATVSFTINRALRPGGAGDPGSLSGTISLVFRTTSSGKIAASETVPTNTASVTVVDTTKPPVSTGGIPALASGQVALFVPGVGHVEGSVGTFISDVSFFDTTGSGAINNLQLYYTPLGNEAISAQTTSVSSVPSSTPVQLADVVSNVFSKSGQSGSLQVRASAIDRLGINANILNISSPRGFYGTTIPIIRSDHSAGPGESFFLTGLREEGAQSHTNLYMQETSGGTVSIHTEFLDASGSVLGTRDDTISPFRLIQVVKQTPQHTVSAILTASGDSTGRFYGYATPVDDESGDTWAVVDWSRQLGYSGSSPTVIPVMGAAHGRNETYFRSDMALLNTGSASATGVLRYVPNGGAPIEKTATLGARQSMILDDVVATYFGVTSDSTGYLTFTPQTGSFAVTSRNFATTPGAPGTYGTGVPTLDAGDVISLGQIQRIGSIDEASQETANNKTPGSFRSNFALVETGGASATVRVTVRYNYAASGIATIRASRFKDIPVGPNSFALYNLGDQIFGSDRPDDDLSNADVEFSVIDGDGVVAAFVSSVDNSSGDSILRTE